VAITFVGNGGQAASADSITPAIHANQAVGDLMILFASGKPFNLGWSVATAGWTSIGRGESGTTAAGIDLGSMVIEVWYKIAIAAPETAPTVTEGSPLFNVVMGSVLTFRKATNESWVIPTVVFGADEVTGTSVSATMSADNNVAAGDRVMCLVAANTDAMGPFTTDATPTQTGVTFGGVAVRDDGETLTGGDMAAHSTDLAVSSGASSAAAVITATGTASGGADRVEVGYVRLRVAGTPGLPLFAPVPFIQGINHQSPI